MDSNQAKSAYLECVQKIRQTAESCGRPVPRLVAVSKKQSIDSIVELARLGHRVFGENYVQELIAKAQLAKSDPRFAEFGPIEFHFIGHLQRNKVKSLLPWVTTIHSVDSVRLYQEIEKQAKFLQWKGTVYFQVNIDREPTKSGFLPEQLDELGRALKDEPVVVNRGGWMAIPDPEKSPREAFKELAAIRDRYREWAGEGLSMGMSSDYPTAIEAGATDLRLGTVLFGARS